MCLFIVCSFFVNDTSHTKIYTYRHTLSRHDALPSLCCDPEKRFSYILCRHGGGTLIQTVGRHLASSTDQGEFGFHHARLDGCHADDRTMQIGADRKSTRLNSSH